MNDDSADNPSQSLSDGERLTLLEQGGRLNRIVLIVLSVALTMALASWATWGLVSLLGDKQQSVGNDQIETLQQQVQASARQLEELQAQLDQLRATANQPPPPATTDGSHGQQSLQQIAGVLIAQEMSFQHSLGALKAGMRDLAGMIAGSRSWLDDYNEALDKTLHDSQERIKRLQQWAAGKDQRPARS